jgi:hypothetical protein
MIYADHSEIHKLGNYQKRRPRWIRSASTF